MCRVTLDSLQSAFAIFNNTTAVIAELGDYDDYENTYTINKLGTADGDMQPYSGSLAEKDYGLHEECQYQFYCGEHDGIKAGSYLIIGNKTYEIIYTAPWDLGITVLLKEADLHCGCEQDNQGDS